MTCTDCTQPIYAGECGCTRLRAPVPPPSMTVAELTALLRANPAAALEAVKAAKIAGPRTSPGGGPASERRGVNGGALVYVTRFNSAERWRADVPSGTSYTMVNSAPGETLAAFTVRADDLWRAQGWILVDDPGKGPA